MHKSSSSSSSSSPSQRAYPALFGSGHVRGAQPAPNYHHHPHLKKNRAPRWRLRSHGPASRPRSPPRRRRPLMCSLALPSCLKPWFGLPMRARARVTRRRSRRPWRWAWTRPSRQSAWRACCCQGCTGSSPRCAACTRPCLRSRTAPRLRRVRRAATCRTAAIERAAPPSRAPTRPSCGGDRAWPSTWRAGRASAPRPPSRSLERARPVERAPVAGGGGVLRGRMVAATSVVRMKPYLGG
mmetsp:Transcript_27053/g.62284  ORF Transcript_27053/g.62284 Transcript_27053/m.62284 type:complete len:240 (-) Transcript_27053:46-765(-)